MKTRSFSVTVVLGTLLLLGGCSKENEITPDTEYPVIDITSATAFPKGCSTVNRGGTFMFQAQLSDNAQLGSVSVDIHNNFDHHNHSTEIETCNLDPVKTPVKPFLLIQTYPIPANLKTYAVQQAIQVPADVDPGDYHFLIRLTDKEGWQTIKGLSIKIK
ncbi:DUF4625 domain-containing protein [Spirosoma aerolatum]|uniref:DUF4625 domain-containing protein n=1 Tax=Spirosoma aerolatum TaxID=1211326 RepID=UPI0009ADF261|nr:DUF4625 domain-containing protein [Spirosoma aerolatum]